MYSKIHLKGSLYMAFKEIVQALFRPKIELLHSDIHESSNNEKISKK